MAASVSGKLYVANIVICGQDGQMRRINSGYLITPYCMDSRDIDNQCKVVMHVTPHITDSKDWIKNNRQKPV
mgnify:CR=1 FL=1